MHGTADEQRRRLLSRTLPTLPEFWRYRLGSSAVNICTALIEYSFGDMELPDDIWADADMATILRNTNIHLSALNDLYSLKKEVATASAESLIPILMTTEGHDLPAAVDHVVAFVADRAEELDRCAERLGARFPHRARDLGRFVDNCRCMCTGNRTWSLSTGRYGIAERDVGADGSVTVDLGEMCVRPGLEGREGSP